MHFFRHNLVRRTTLLFLLSWGLLTQVATVYACESENGKKQISCCCDTAGKMDCKHKNSKCENLSGNSGDNSYDSATHNSSNNLASDCCDISYGVTDASLVSSKSSTTALQVLLLDASQPPPVLLNDQPNILVRIASLTIPPQSTPPSTGTHTYLHTQRLRI